MVELVHSVALRAGISPAQAVSAMLAFLAARLPSPTVGHIHELLLQSVATAGGTSEGVRS